MIDAIAGILLVLVGGLCVVAFPFVLWMLFGDAPRSRRYTSGPPRSGTAEPSIPSEDHEEASPPYDEAEEGGGFK
jgi:hypothetical protein